jgi:hypothetical protein
MKKRRRKETFSDRFWLDKDGKLAIWQRPNLPLIIWIATILVQIVLGASNQLSQISKALGAISLLIWAILEAFRGVCYFRQLLGVFVLLLMALIYL